MHISQTEARYLPALLNVDSSQEAETVILTDASNKYKGTCAFNSLRKVLYVVL
jgi:hypothetical protein